MDWLVYAAYGIIPDPGPILPDADLSLRRDSGPSVSGRRRMVTSLEPCNSSRRTGRLPVGRCGRHGCDSSATTNTSAASSSRCTSVAGRSNGRSAIPGSAANRPTTPSSSTPSAWWLSEKAEWWLEFQKGGGPVALPEWTAGSGPTRARICGVGGRRRNRTPSGRVEGSAGRIRGPRRSTLDATFVAFAKSFKALVREQSVSENLPFRDRGRRSTNALGAGPGEEDPRPA